MIKNKKLLYGILAVVVLAIVGIGLYVSPALKITPPLLVTITTDKTEYQRGETAKITVKNGLERSIFGDFGYCGGDPFWGLEKFAGGNWIRLNFSLPLLYSGKETCDVVLCERVESAELKTTSEIKDQWHLTNVCEWPEESIGVPKTEPKHIEEGNYRISFTYGLGREGFNLLETKTIYSDEFTIKEKIGMTSPKNCDLYEMPMTEEEIEECICPGGYEKMNRLSGAYCATNSQEPCSAHTDCPQGEHCISGDGEKWFCTGQFAGCYFHDPENPEEQICAD